MPEKRDTQTTNPLSAAEQAQIEQLLEQIQTIADQLYAAATEQEAAGALAVIERLTENSQLALVKALAKVEQTEAADILSAVNMLSTHKSVRKEARRSLIRLEAARVYPQWSAPVSRQPLVQLPTTQAPRFWRGYASQSREEGEIYLVLSWEQGLDYGEVRMLTFLMDFWLQGIKDFVIETMSKRDFEAKLQEMKRRLADVTLTDCTLSEGRRLIEAALSVNQWRNAPAHKEFRHYRPMINQLILNADIDDEDRGLTFINSNIEPDELAATFIAAWSMGDYDLTYSVLARDSALRDGLERGEWIAQRRAWANEAHPSRFELSYVREREASETTSAIWLPTAFLPGGRSGTRKDVEIAWALELSETPLSGTLKEMPLATAVYKETGRRWFWTSYTLAQDRGQWRIQKMSDDGANAQALAIDELQNRIKEHTDRVNEIMQTRSLDEPDAQQYSDEIVWRMTQCIYYDDALIVHLPLDRVPYGDAYTRAISLGAVERAIVYLEKLAQKFVEQKAELLRTLGIAQSGLSEQYGSLNMPEREQQFAALAEQSLHDSLAIQETAPALVLLAEELIRRDGNLDDAEQRLLRAREMVTTTQQQTQIEDDLANIALKRDKLNAALQHYQRIAELDPTIEDLWFKISSVQQAMKQPDAAKATIEQAIERNPDDPAPYAHLATLYMNEQNAAQAKAVLERGLAVKRDSAPLLALLASVYIDEGDLRRADTLLKQAEKLNPNLEIVQAAREMLNRAVKNQ
jgi:tetratricopeptide (TPR) repeat protein